MLDGCSCCCFKLDDRLAVVQGLLVNDDLQIEVFGFHHPLEGGQVEPNVVSIEDLEFTDGLEIFQVLRGDLSDFEEANRTLIVDKGTTLSRET